MKTYLSLTEIQKEIQEDVISCKALVKGYLDRIEKKRHLNIFLEVFEEDALLQAAGVDQKLQKKKAGKLAGLVIAIKDNICYKNHPVSAASKILEGFVSLYSATVVERLLAEDAIIIGRLNCDEFAMGSSNENSAFGPVRSPLDPAKVPGGSSGGATAAVCANLCHAALGSDTGGSIRQPASFCGVVGLKPTYGRVSRYGLIAYASSFDQIGPITKSVEDAAKILEVIAGQDEYDSTTSSEEVPSYISLLKTDKKYAIGYIQDCLEREGLAPEIKSETEKLIISLKEEGHTVEPVRFPFLDYMVPAYYVLTTAEASSNLARFGGVIYGKRSFNAMDVDSTFRKSRTEGFGKEVKRRIMLGTFVLSSGYYDAYYMHAQKVRKLLQNRTNDIFNQYDFILSPTTPKTAFDIGTIKDPITMYLEDIFTVQANLTGCPAISLPLGKAQNSLPFGIQFMADRFRESELMAFCTSLFDSRLAIKDPSAC